MSWRVDQKSREDIERLLREQVSDRPPADLKDACLTTIDAAQSHLLAASGRAQHPPVPRSPHLSRAFAWGAVGVMAVGVIIGVLKTQDFGIVAEKARPGARAPMGVPGRAPAAPGAPRGALSISGNAEAPPSLGIGARPSPPGAMAPGAPPGAPTPPPNVQFRDGSSQKLEEEARDRVQLPEPEAPSAGPPMRDYTGSRGESFTLFAPPTEPWDEVVQGRKEVLQSEVEVAVRDLQKAVKEVREITEAAGGFVAAHNFDDTRRDGKATFTLRVPSKNLEHVIRQIEDLGRVVRSSGSGLDVTERYVGEGDRIRELSSREDDLVNQYESTADASKRRQLLSEIERVRRERDALKQDLQGLKSEVEMSTVQVTLHKRGTTLSMGGGTNGPLDPVAVWDQAARVAGLALRFVLAVVLWVIALAPIWVPLAIAAWWFKRPRRVAEGQ